MSTYGLGGIASVGGTSTSEPDISPSVVRISSFPVVYLLCWPKRPFQGHTVHLNFIREVGEWPEEGVRERPVGTPGVLDSGVYDTELSICRLASFASCSSIRARYSQNSTSTCCNNWHISSSPAGHHLISQPTTNSGWFSHGWLWGNDLDITFSSAQCLFFS